MPSAQKAIALPRSCGANDSSSTACHSGCSAPPVAPCRMRKTISDSRFGAMPHRTEAAVKPPVAHSSRFLRPKTLASQPVMGRMIAFATRYDVSAQVASSIVDDRLPAMCGSDTFTTVVSSTSMNVANITEVAISHGLIGWGESVIRNCRIAGLQDCRIVERDQRCRKDFNNPSVILQSCNSAILQFSSGVYRRDHGHSGAQQVLRILACFERD